METTNQNKPTMQALWLLLHPSVAYDTRGRYERCRRDWHAMDEAQQLRVYKLIEARLAGGEGVNPNPFYALNDAMQEDEQLQAKITSGWKDIPENYFGRQLARGKTYYKADYRGQRGLYTEEDVRAHRMTNAELFMRT